MLSLKSVTFQLSALLNETTANGALSQEDQRDFNQLHMYFCQLYLEYETKLVFLVTSNPSHHGTSLTFRRRGCPRKITNLALVRMYKVFAN